MRRPTQRLLVQSSTMYEQPRYSTVWRLLHPIRVITSLRFGRVRVEIPHDSGLGAPFGLSPIVTRSITWYLAHYIMDYPTRLRHLHVGGDSLSRSCFSPVLLLLFFPSVLSPTGKSLNAPTAGYLVWRGKKKHNHHLRLHCPRIVVKNEHDVGLIDIQANRHKRDSPNMTGQVL